jgi:hypothetical protein
VKAGRPNAATFAITRCDSGHEARFETAVTLQVASRPPVSAFSACSAHAALRACCQPPCVLHSHTLPPPRGCAASHTVGDVCSLRLLRFCATRSCHCSFFSRAAPYLSSDPCARPVVLATSSVQPCCCHKSAPPTRAVGALCRRRPRWRLMRSTWESSVRLDSHMRARLMAKLCTQPPSRDPPCWPVLRWCCTVKAPRGVTLQ